jgi:hypothetical protein
VAASLQSGATQSCGCLHKERTSEISKKNLVGQKFGRLMVVEDAGRTKQGKVIWRCVCECGTIKDIKSSSLSNGATQSCGCLQKERASKANSGECHHSWKGGLSPLNEAVRTCARYKEWRTSIFHKDNFICVHCGTRGGDLIVHHIKFFSVIMEEHNITTLEEAIQCEALWSTNNGITLCVGCHEEEHQRLKAIARESAHSNFITKPNQFDIDIKIKQNHYMIVQNGV